MMNLSTLPLSFWDYALEYATRILNMVPTKKVDKTPYELWYGKVPNLSYLKETMGYYFYFPPENKIVVVRYFEFLKKNLISQEVSGRVVDIEEIQDEDTSPSKNTNKIPMEVEEVEEHSLGDLNEPANYKATILDPESDKWLDAMNAKIQSMKDNQVWCLVDLPPDAKVFTQTYRVDYEETFSPVADIRAIRILIAITASYDYEIWQMDVKTAFLNGYLDEDIYMVQPEGFVDPKHLKKVCKLQISIYSLKQALKSWNKRFDEEIKKFGFAQNLDEPCVYQKASGSNVTFLILYVDDIIIMGNHIPSLQSAVGWKSSKQSTTAMSAIEAEYIAALEAVMEAVWIRKFISGLGIVPTINEPIKIFCDNSAALLIANEPRVQKGTRHYHRRYHFIRECIELGEINLLKVHADDNLADPFTKALPKGKLIQHARSMGLCLASSFM
ncbi:retrotransposon protein, putative, ty1-copia subclass [Tanacetum coccineum]